MPQTSVLASVDSARISSVDTSPLLNGAQKAAARPPQQQDPRNGTYSPPTLKSSVFDEAGKSSTPQKAALTAVASSQTSSIDTSPLLNETEKSAAKQTDMADSRNGTYEPPKLAKSTSLASGRISSVDSSPLLDPKQKLEVEQPDTPDPRKGTYKPPTNSLFAEAGKNVLHPSRFAQPAAQKPVADDVVGQEQATSPQQPKPTASANPTKTSEAGSQKTDDTPTAAPSSSSGPSIPPEITNIQALEKLATSLTGLTKEDLAERLPIKEAKAFERAFSRIVDVAKEFFAEVADKSDQKDDPAVSQSSQPSVPQTPGDARPANPQSGETPSTNASSAGQKSFNTTDGKVPQFDNNELVEKLLEALTGLSKNNIEELLASRQRKAEVKSMLRLIEEFNELANAIQDMK